MSQDIAPILPKSDSFSLSGDATADFSGVPSQPLDAVRMRLAQLSHSLRKIRDELSKADLPQWYSLQSQLNVTLSQLTSATSTLQHFHDTLNSTVVYPLPKFPTTSHEDLLTTLLRKKYAPEINDWVKESKEASTLDVNSLTNNDINKILFDDNQLTKWTSEVLENASEMFDIRASQDRDGDTRMGGTEVSRGGSFKPKVPFDVDEVLAFQFSGKLKSASVVETVNLT